MTMNSLTSTGVALVAFALPAIAGFAARDNPEEIPPKIIQTFEANFPPGLLADGITSGHVRAVLQIDADGTLGDLLIVAYTHRALATELAASVREWRFEPARSRGEPIGTRTEIQFGFEAKGAVLSLTALQSSTALTRWLPAETVSLVSRPGELDRPLVALKTVPPPHPGLRLRPAQPAGEAVIDFYIDAEGRPRMPVVLRASHDAFGAAAADALAQWQFSPPTRGGQPVAVRVQQTFLFKDPREQSRGTD